MRVGPALIGTPFSEGRRTRLVAGLILLVVTLLLARPASAWGPTGHEIVGETADQLLNPRARTEVRRLLGFDLKTAAKWADCVRSVERTRDGGFAYNRMTPYQPPCEPLMSPRELARLERFAAQNWFTCQQDGGRPCHETFHYTNVAVQRGRYLRGYIGTSDHDVVAAITNSIRVLEGRSAEGPFVFADRADALLVLAHVVGDVHQPLHAGSIYLAPDGGQVDPDAAPGDLNLTHTRGGNQLRHGDERLHSEWDQVPARLVARSPGDWARRARAVPMTRGPLASWGAQWATQSLRQAAWVFQHMEAEPRQGSTWAVTFTAADYARRRDEIQERQLVLAGKRLADVLNRIWP